MRKTTLHNCVLQAGKIVRGLFGQDLEVAYKGDQSNIVTSADLASEKRIIELIRQRHPEDGILGEETGFQPGQNNLTWVIDPLDGTSNFAAGIPWFGVLLAVLQDQQPVMAAMYLPVTEELYFAESGQGATRNNLAVRVNPATDLRGLLCAYSMDSSRNEAQTRQQTACLGRLVNRARNVRSTNCLLDFCFTVDGRLGACINHSTKIWDIAAANLLLREAGGVLSDFQGVDMSQVWRMQDPQRSYAVAGASRALHPQIIEILRA